MTTGRALFGTQPFSDRMKLSVRILSFQFGRTIIDRTGPWPIDRTCRRGDEDDKILKAVGPPAI
jgi:hypothetical protein